MYRQNLEVGGEAVFGRTQLWLDWIILVSIIISKVSTAFTS